MVVRDLGVHLDAELTIKQHISRIVSSCFFQLDDCIKSVFLLVMKSPSVWSRHSYSAVPVPEAGAETKFSERAFSHAGTAVCNSLPYYSVGVIIKIFKNYLKLNSSLCRFNLFCCFTVLCNVRRFICVGGHKPI